VEALQYGRNIFVAEISFKRTADQDGIEHQAQMPGGLPRADDLPTSEEMVAQLLAQKHEVRVENALRFHLFEPNDLDIRFVEQPTFSDLCSQELKKRDPRQCFWVRVKGRLPDSMALHQAIAAYFTDHLLLSTSLRPSGLHIWNPEVVRMATVDHCLWFHQAFRVDQWLLYQMESTRAGGGRGFCTGRLFTEQGEMVASCAQEGVIYLKSNV